jgi:hypothetical protein
MVTEVRERLAINQQTVQNFYMERFNFKKLNEVECREQCQVKISNRSAALENVGDDLDVSRVLETIREKYQNFSQRELSLL